ncbi:transcription elongation factor TFIIS [Mangifera indica]|uniref:transcription elongation factor TFIIS n=1 Tax=Mangifera indica TaxID=29780 RepID=UPI001CF9CEBE|nr:transcription elongation factor TFIIS [Mangifera indica]XP_044493464.1 transcription elongation factor TFIIS [Mangifera indica]
MEKELVELFEAAKKAADAAAVDGTSSSGPEVSRSVDALKQLKSFPVTYDILVSTQVGKRLRPLTKHPREKIQNVASDLLEIWKKIVIEETTRNNKNGSTEVKVEKVQKAVKVEKSSTKETVKFERSGTFSRSDTVRVEKREVNGNAEPVKVEKIIKEEKPVSSVKKPTQTPIGTPKLTELVRCNDSLRDKIRELLVEALSKVAGEADEEDVHAVNACDPIRVAVSVESVMFEKLGRSNGAQKLKYRSIMFNIKDPKNPDLRRKVLLGEVKPERLVTMSPEEMASDARQQEINQIKEKALFDCERGGAPKATTDQFKCGRCGQRKCTYYQMQTRSADEPMTTYVTCVNCNNHWKFC